MTVNFVCYRRHKYGKNSITICADTYDRSLGLGGRDMLSKLCCLLSILLTFSTATVPLADPPSSVKSSSSSIAITADGKTLLARLQFVERILDAVKQVARVDISPSCSFLATFSPVFLPISIEPQGAQCAESICSHLVPVH